MELVYSKFNKTVISGFRGFIGSNLVSSYPEKYDIINLENIENYEVTFFVHLANKVTSYQNSLTKNIDTDMEIFSLCLKKNYKLIYASGNNVYPFEYSCGIDKKTEITDLYSASKIFSEKLLKEYFKLDSYILRIGDVFGKNQNQGNFFKGIQKSISNSEDLNLYGNGLKRRNYIYIKDLIKLINFIINENKVKLGTYNISYDASFSLKEILNSVSEKTNLKIKNINYENEDTTVRTLIPSNIENFSYTYNMDSAIDDYIKEIQNV
jgi:nucleoside-diphosphate-sugar epimerase